MKSRSSSLLDRFLDRLIKMPAWINLTLGIGAYVLIEWFRRTSLSSPTNPIIAVSSSIYAPVVLTLFLATGLFGAFQKARRADTLEQQTGLGSLRDMNWKAFERLVAELYERQGYKVDYQLENGPDGGVDLELKKGSELFIVQCKCWRHQLIGVNVVREMFGLLHHHGAQEAIIVSTGDFTTAALDFAKGKPMTLINGPALWELVAGVKKCKTTDEALSEVGLSACPKCGSAMVLKTAGRGLTKGTRFWGCSKYPACKSTRSLEGSGLGTQ